MRQLVLRYFECVNAEDWQSMRDLWAEDSTLAAVGARPRDGRDDVLGYFLKAFAPWPEHRDEPTRLIVSEESQVVVAEVTFTGASADGRPITFDAVDVFDCIDGRIRRLTSWYDVDLVRGFLEGP